MHYFGKEYDAPAYEGATQVSTPVGEICLFCTEEIEAGDDGWMMPFVSGGEPNWTRELVPIHRECELRSVVGSVAHQRGECHCVTGNYDAEDRYIKEFGGRRGEAKAAMEEFFK